AGRRLGSGYPWRRRRTLVLGAAEAEDQEENERQQKQTDSKTNAFSEALCHVDAKDDPDDEIHKRNEHQDYPPTRSPRDLAQKVCVHNWNNGCPAWLSGFGENFPERSDHQNDECEPADPEDWTRCLAL